MAGPEPYLSSAANPLIKSIKRAIGRGGLTADGLAVAEGVRLLTEAARTGVAIDAVLASEDAPAATLGAARAVGPLRIVARQLFQQIASTETSQGVIFLVRPPRRSLDEVFAGEGPVVVLDGVQDPGNAGAIARSAEAFRAAGAIFCSRTASPHNPKTLRASAGSLWRLPYVAGLGPEAAARECSGRGRRLLAASAHEGTELERVDFTRSGIVIGSEAHGVRPALAEVAERIHIPTRGVESLNAAAAAAIILYQARRAGRQ